MLRKINRSLQNWMRPKRLALGKYIWDRKDKKTACSEDNIIEKNNIKSILFLRYDGKIGDMVVNTLMFREIKKVHSEIKIGVVARGAATDIIKNNPHVDKIYKYEKSSSEIKKLAGEIAEEKYDLLIDFSEMLRVKEMMFINLSKARINMGLDRKNWNLFDVSVDSERDFQWNDHITERYAGYLKKLGIKNPDKSYDIFLDEDRKAKAKEFYSQIKEEKIAVLNPYGASRHKNFNFETLSKIIKYLKTKKTAAVLLAPPDKKEAIEEFLKQEKSENLYFNEEIKSILDSAALIENSDLVITPDTSIVHIASAFKRKIISVYPPNGGLRGIDHLAWGPVGEDTVMIFCKEIKNSSETMDINSFSFEEMKEYIDSYLK